MSVLDYAGSPEMHHTYFPLLFRWRPHVFRWVREKRLSQRLAQNISTQRPSIHPSTFVVNMTMARRSQEQSDEVVPQGPVGGPQGSNGEPSQTGRASSTPSTSIHRLLPPLEDFASPDEWCIAVLEFVLLVDSLDENDELFRNMRPSLPPRSKSSGVSSSSDTRSDSSGEDTATGQE
eukprot:scaffold45373_cov206-Amphora_coffeaeformis.AAC.2